MPDGLRVVPMDESLAEVALDYSVRPYIVFCGEFASHNISDLETQSIKASMESLADGCRSIQRSERRLWAYHSRKDCLGFDHIMTSLGQKVKITDEGMLRLKAEYMDYQKISSGGEHISKN